MMKFATVIALSLYVGKPFCHLHPARSLSPCDDRQGRVLFKKKGIQLIAIVVGRGEPCKCTLETMRESSCLAIPMVRMRQSNHLSLHRNDII